MLKYNSTFNQNSNNTSISFLLTSEFKSNWESFAKDQIMEAFENTFDNYYWLSHTVQDVLRVIYEETDKMIKQKVNLVVKTLGIEEDNTEKLYARFKPFFQEYFASIFIFSDEILSKFRKILLDLIQGYKGIEESIREGIKQDIESKYFKGLVNTIFNICIYMHLHDPQIFFSIQPFEKRKLEYNYFIKNEYIVIEGFANDNSTCVIVARPPSLKNNFAFQGIKPCVYVVANPSDEIISICNQNKSQKKQSFFCNSEINVNKENEASPSKSKIENNFRSQKNQVKIESNTSNKQANLKSTNTNNNQKQNICLTKKQLVKAVTLKESN